MKRVGVDVGGTFTDLIYVDDEAGEIAVHKLATTPADPSIGTVDGIRQLIEGVGQEASALDQVFHGTTIATNIVIEHNGARVGMLTSEGYRDILHIARHKKPLNFSNYQDLPWQAFPIVRRRYRLPIAGRIDKDGSVLRDIDEAEIREQVQKLKKAEVEAVAVCLLFSFLNNEHEARVAEIVREEMPDTFVSVSSEVLPQYREYERFSTVALNAFVGPKVSRYVGRLQDSLAELGVKSGLHLMTSASGVATTEVSLSRPVNLLMSGPVAGVVGGIWAGRQAGFGNVITLDVGGTSADIGLAQDGKLRMKHLLDTKVGPYQAMVPMVDVDTIGAGGGSIVYVDHGGIFRVGPRSAGADPGPACYMRGGTEPTSTDAMVNLGWLRAETFLGGGMEVNPDLARDSFSEVSQTLGMSIEEASMGAIQILSSLMEQAIEQNSVRKGFDPRDFALVAEGGAGPLFSPQIGVNVGTPFVLVPPFPGITSAMGLLATDMVYEYGSTVYARMSELDAAGLQASFEVLERQAQDQLEADGVAAENILVQRICECRYLGQGYELRVDAPSGTHRRRLGRADPRLVQHDPRARVLAQLPGRRHRDPEHPRARGRSHAGAEDARRGLERRRRLRGSARRAPRLVPGEREARAGDHEVLRPRAAALGQPDRGPRDREPVRLDHSDPARSRGGGGPRGQHRDPHRRGRPRARPSKRYRHFGLEEGREHVGP